METSSLTGQWFICNETSSLLRDGHAQVPVEGLRARRTDDCANTNAEAVGADQQRRRERRAGYLENCFR